VRLMKLEDPTFKELQVADPCVCMVLLGEPVLPLSRTKGRVEVLSRVLA